MVTSRSGPTCRRLAAVAAASFLGALCLAADTVEGDAGRRLDAAVAATAGAGFRGAVLVAEKGKTLLAKGYGAADGAKSPMTAESLFDVASVSKQFTAAAVFKLAEAKKLALDDSIAKHLPKVPADKKAITIQHLLNHTAGLPLLIPGLDENDSADRDRFVAKVLAAPLAGKPGAAFVYDNHGYSLLAAIVEREGGKPFETWMRAEVFAPAGMADTGFLGEKQLDGKRLTARISLVDGKPVPSGDASTFPWDWSMRGAGGVVSTVRDLERWDRALRDGRVASKAGQERMFRPALEGFASGWMVGELDAKGGPAWVFHTGRTLGYQAYVARWLAQDRVIVVLTDEATDPRVLHGPLVTALAGK